MWGHWHNEGDFFDGAEAFTYRVFFPETFERYIGVKKLSGKWKTYTTSSKRVNQKIKNGERAVFVIVQFFKTYREAHEAEIAALRAYDVLHCEQYLNANVGGFFEVTPEVRQRISESLKGRTYSEETKQRLSKKLKGIVRTEAQKANTKRAAQLRETKYTDKQRTVMNAKRSAALKGKPRNYVKEWRKDNPTACRGGAKLSENDVYAIRYIDDLSYSELAKKYNVSVATISRTKTFKCFPEITENWELNSETTKNGKS